MQNQKQETSLTLNQAIENPGLLSAEQEYDVLDLAAQILQKRLRRPTCWLSKPRDAIELAQLKTHDLEHEVFGVMYLNNDGGVIDHEILFRGTLDGCSVPTREVVKAVLAVNAAGVVFYHNHPSGNVTPSQEDITLTNRLKAALHLVGVSVRDHIIVGGLNHYSFHEHGRI